MAAFDSTYGAVIACIPYYRCKEYIRRSVESLLNQTYRDLTVVVANDGDADPPWSELASIRDDRLIRFEMAQNRGPYFVTSVVLQASNAPYLLIQDADDWSDRTRVSALLRALQHDQSSFAISAQTLYCEQEGKLQPSAVRWTEVSMAPQPPRRFMLNPTITSEFLYRAPHHGLFRSQALRDVGGYYIGLSLSYDRLVTNLLLMTGTASHIETSLYFRLIRTSSLTHSPATAWNSERGIREFEQCERIYSRCYEQYQKYRSGTLPLGELFAFIRQLTWSQIMDNDRSSLINEVARLKSHLRSPSGAVSR